MSFSFGIPVQAPENEAGVVLDEQNDENNSLENPQQSRRDLVTSTSSFPFGSVTSCANATGTTNTLAFGAASNQAFGATNSQAFGSTTRQAFGSTNSQAFGSTRTRQAFGSTNNQAFGSTNNQAFGSTNNQAFGSKNNQGFGSTNSQAFGSTKTQTFGSSNAQVFGVNNNNLGSANTSSTQTFGGPSVPQQSGGTFGAATGRGRTFLNYTIPSNAQGLHGFFPYNNTPINSGKFGTTNINVNEPITITGYNDKKGFVVMNPTYIPARGVTTTNRTGKLSTANITANQPINISAQAGFKFGIPPVNAQPNGYFGVPPTRSNGTNINVNQPITITGYGDKNFKCFTNNTQPSHGLYSLPRSVANSINELSSTNITVNKPITISVGNENNFKFGIHPTPAQSYNFGTFNTPRTVTSISELGLEKLCTTNISVNKPISITGTFENLF